MTCLSETELNALFDEGPGAQIDNATPTHLEQCPSCQARVDRIRHVYDALAATPHTPTDDRTFVAQVAKRLPGDNAPEKNWTRRVWAPVMAGAMAAAAVATLALLPPDDPTDGGFAPRGSNRTAELLAYRMTRGTAPTRLTNTIGPDDELAFGYRTDGTKRFLLVFGVDDTRRVYWFHPAWNEPSRNPTAVPITTARGVHELGEAVSHRLRGRRLFVYGVFCDRSLTVRQVERLVAETPKAGQPLPLETAVQTILKVQVERSSNH